jgi:hypothetical protein
MFAQDHEKGNDKESDNYYNTIHITGAPSDIQEATNDYFALLQSLEPQVLKQEVSFRKYSQWEWVFRHRSEEVRKIMYDNAVTIQPASNSFGANLGSNATISAMTGFTIFGIHSHLIERAIRAVKRLVCEYYVASIQTSNVFENAEQFSRYVSDATSSVIQAVSEFDVEVTISRNIIEIAGLASQTKLAYSWLARKDWVRIRDTKLQIELLLEHKDFIQGKKNGKVNRIIKTSGVRLSFSEPPNDVNMVIDLYSPNPDQLLMGVDMLEEELPAEMSFHIPETYHKRIIGVAGKNIQKIMKKYGVYVKFSNLEEYEALGGYFENQDNVICRTPSKNRSNLQELKNTIIETIQAVDLLESMESVLFPRQLVHWCTSGTESIYVMEQETGVRIDLPLCESGTDLINFDGPVAGLEQVKARLLALIPSISDFQTPGGAATHGLIKKPEFHALKKKLEADEISVSIFAPSSDSELEFSFYLIYSKLLNKTAVDEAKSKFSALFQQFQVPFTAKPSESFQAFNSKLLDSRLGLFSGSAPSSVQNIRQLFEDSNGPPGLPRSGSSDLRKSQSVIGGRPSAPSSSLVPNINVASATQ